MKKKNHIVQLNSIQKKETSHPGISKHVFFENNDFKSNVQQFAYSSLKEGDIVNEHSHQTMEEVFFMLSGKCIFYINEKKYQVEKHTSILIPSGSIHKIEASTDCSFIYFGIST